MTILPPFSGRMGRTLGSPIVTPLAPNLPGRLSGVTPRTFNRDDQRIIIRPAQPMTVPQTRGFREEPRLRAPGQLVQRPRIMASGPSTGLAGREEHLASPFASPVVQQQRLRDFVIQSRSVSVPLAGRLRPNVAGRLGAITVNRLNSPFVGDPFRSIVGTFGEPRHQFFFVPRDRFFFRDFDFDDPFFFRDFDRDDFFFFHHRAVFFDFFFPFFIDDPFLFGFSDINFFPSPFFFFGWTPGWINASRGFVDPAAYAPSGNYGGNYALDFRGARAAITDIRHAWLDNNPDRLAAHLSDQYDVQVYLDGKYRYTTSDKDFYEMTLDTLATSSTSVMDLRDPIWIAPDQVFYTGRQVFVDPDGATHTLYVSYRLQQAGGNWYIIGYGTSLSPIQSEYRDFRY